jgi:hypothetical protein
MQDTSAVVANAGPMRRDPGASCRGCQRRRPWYSRISKGVRRGRMGSGSQLIPVMYRRPLGT